MIKLVPLAVLARLTSELLERGIKFEAQPDDDSGKFWTIKLLGF